jgi:hypothetical protein
MANRFQDHWDALVRAVSDGDGELEPPRRRDLVDGKGTAGLLGAFAIKVAENPNSITDDHVHALIGAGVSEEQIFECIIAASLSSGLARLRQGLRALGDDP